ncbi:hypothetical protein DK45_2640 [Bordetella bronchiseptica]|nr:hypothetical protein DK45_2640 [Bordetella bronchiseptica]
MNARRCAGWPSAGGRAGGAHARLRQPQYGVSQ